MKRRPATAKINLALVVGPRRADGRHDVTTVLQRVDLYDRIVVGPAASLRVTGFAPDTLVRDALLRLAQAAGVPAAWTVDIRKRIPVGSGLGGGSSDAATALRVANATLPQPLPDAALHEIAASVGADVPFFLESGPQLGTGDGTELSPLALPQDYWVLLAHPHGARKHSTASVYEAFDERRGETAHGERRAALLDALAAVRRPRDLGALPRNDLAASPLAEELCALGAFRADVSGAGPAVYGLFVHRRDADAAARSFGGRARVWLTVPAWYG